MQYTLWEKEDLEMELAVLDSYIDLTYGEEKRYQEIWKELRRRDEEEYV